LAGVVVLLIVVLGFQHIILMGGRNFEHIPSLRRRPCGTAVGFDDETWSGGKPQKAGQAGALADT